MTVFVNINGMLPFRLKKAFNGLVKNNKRIRHIDNLGIALAVDGIRIA